MANQRVEAVLHRANLWVQTDLNGQEKGRWDTGPNGRPAAITEDGRAWRKDGNKLEVFDRSTGAWRAVAFDAPGGDLLGAEGNNLVFNLRYENTLRWVTAPGETTK